MLSLLLQAGLKAPPGTCRTPATAPHLVSSPIHLLSSAPATWPPAAPGQPDLLPLRAFALAVPSIEHALPQKFATLTSSCPSNLASDFPFHANHPSLPCLLTLLSIFSIAPLIFQPTNLLMYYIRCLLSLECELPRGRDIAVLLNNMSLVPILCLAHG